MAVTQSSYSVSNTLATTYGKAVPNGVCGPVGALCSLDMLHLLVEGSEDGMNFRLSGNLAGKFVAKTNPVSAPTDRCVRPSGYPCRNDGVYSSYQIDRAASYVRLAVIAILDAIPDADPDADPDGWDRWVASTIEHHPDLDAQVLADEGGVPEAATLIEDERWVAVEMY